MQLPSSDRQNIIARARTAMSYALSAVQPRALALSEGLASAAHGIPAKLSITVPGLLFTVHRVWQEIGKDRVLSVAGGLAFFALLALFPAISALVSLVGLVADPAQVSERLSGLHLVLPAEAADILVGQAKSISATSSDKLTFAAIFGLLFALWSANGGTKALIEALNVAYGVPEGRGVVRLNLITLATTISCIVCSIVLITVVAFLPRLLQFVWLGRVGETVLLLGRWPAIFALVLCVLAVAYRWGPNRREVSWRWITPGAILAAVGILLFSLLFNWYVGNVSNYNQTYGSLGAVVALMTWIWMSATLVLVGAELNAELDRQTMRAEKKGPVAAPVNASR